MQTSQAAFDTISEAIAGVTISHVWRGYGSALFVECGPLTPSEARRHDGSLRNPTGQWTIGFEFDWRIEENARILCGSHGEETGWDAILQSLFGDVVESVETFGDLPELRVTLRSGRRLLTFALDADGPQWALTDNAAVPPVWVYWSDGVLIADDGNRPR